MFRFLVQCGTGCPRVGQSSVLEPLLVIGVISALGAFTLTVLHVSVTRSRGAFRLWQSRRRALRAAALAEGRARAMMSELCPYGWRATIDVDGSESHRSDDRDSARGGVVLEWAELGPDGSRPNVVRSVRAQTIAAALEAMVADRRTDETLEQIERGAVADGTLWPDL